MACCGFVAEIVWLHFILADESVRARSRTRVITCLRAARMEVRRLPPVKSFVFAPFRRVFEQVRDGKREGKGNEKISPHTRPIIGHSAVG